MKSGKLGDLVTITIGRTPSRSDSSYWDRDRKEDNVWLSISDLLNTQGKIVSDSKEYITEDAANGFALVPKGTLLVSFKLTLGRLAFAGRDLRTNEAIAALRNDEEKVLNDYLYYYLSHFDWMAYASSDKKVKGFTLNKAKLNEIIVFYPESKHEQQRIIDKLDAAFEKIEESLNLNRINQNQVDALIASLMREYFLDQGSQSYLLPLSEITEQIVAGGDVPKGNWSKEKSTKYHIPIYTNGEKNDGLYGYTDSARILKPSITVSARGTIGYASIRNAPFYPAIRLISVVPKESVVELSYLYYALKSLNFINTGSSIPQLTVPMLKNYPVPIKEKNEQKKIAAKLDKIYASRKEVKDLYQEKARELTALKQSLLSELILVGDVK